MIERGFDRRKFLAGDAGGAAAAGLPFLEAFRGKAYAGSGDRPLRLVIFFHESGVMPGEFVPTRTGRDFPLSPMLAPLESHRQKLTVVSGLKHEARWLTQGNNHTEAKTALLTGAGSYPGPGEENWANGPSVDQVLASRLPARRRRTLDILVGNQELWYENVVSFSGPNQPVTSRYSDPVRLFRELFGDFDTSPSTREALAVRRRSVLDGVRSNFALYRGKLGREDRTRLDAHESYLSDLERRLQIGVGSGCTPPAQQPPAYDYVDDIQRALRDNIDVAVRALACDMTRVAVIYPHTQQVGHFGEAQVPGGVWHTFLHTEAGDVVTSQPALRRQFFRWHYEQLAYLLDQMDAIDEGGCTLLDNSLVLGISEFGNGATHDQDRTEKLPVVLAGGLDGRIRSNQHVAYSDRNHNDLLITILRAFGFDDQVFGEASLCRGPLTELLT